MSKKVLIVSYDPVFPAAIVESFKDFQNINFLSAGNLSDGIAILESSDVTLLIVDYAIVLDKAISNFLSSQSIGKIPIILIAQEKKFLDGFSGPNISKFSRDKLDSCTIPFVKKILASGS